MFENLTSPRLTSPQVNQEIRVLTRELTRYLRRAIRSSTPSSVVQGLATLYVVCDELVLGAVPVVDGPTWVFLRDVNNGTVRSVIDRLDPAPEEALVVVDKLENLTLAIAEIRVSLAVQPHAATAGPSALARVLRWLADRV